MTRFSIQDHAFAAALKIDLGPVEAEGPKRSGMRIAGDGPRDLHYAVGVNAAGDQLALLHLEDFLQLANGNNKHALLAAKWAAEAGRQRGNFRSALIALMLAVAVIAGLLAGWGWRA